MAKNYESENKNLRTAANSNKNEMNEQNSRNAKNERNSRNCNYGKNAQDKTENSKNRY